MKKLHLDLETLRIDSFATDAPGSGRGTVAAHALLTNTRPTCVYHCTFAGCPETELCM